MPVKIRLTRHGKKHNAYYHIVVADGRAPRDGKFIEVIGNYNPNTNPATIELNNEKALDWLSKGAQPTDTMRAILSYKGVLYKKHLAEGVKKGALTQEIADEKFQQWLEAKDGKITEKKNRLAGASVKEIETRLAEETKKKEAKAELIRVKNTPPPVEEAAPIVEVAAEAAPEPSAEVPAAPEASAETPAAE